MSYKADLHIHTTASDGSKTPLEIAAMAAEAGLSAISITDHDTYQSYFKASSACSEAGIDVIPGIEITSDYKGRECHILGYGFDLGNEDFLGFIQSQKMRRYKRARKMIENLNRMGYELTIEEILAESRTLNISRNHIAAVMVQKGYAGHKNTVFTKWIGNQSAAYYKTEYESYEEVIRLIKRAGGVAILAHPAFYYIDDDIQVFIESGIDGFECFHPSHNTQFQIKYAKICEEHDLLITGGSDYHGHREEEDKNFGEITIGRNHVDALLERCHARVSQPTE
jgi:predicted metal-dependent phosphoesterase TrpH